MTERSVKGKERCITSVESRVHFSLSLSPFLETNNSRLFRYQVKRKREEKKKRSLMEIRLIQIGTISLRGNEVAKSR